MLRIYEHYINKNRQNVKNPLKPTIDYRNKPSRGVQIDVELQREDEEMLKKKHISFIKELGLRDNLIFFSSLA